MLFDTILTKPFLHETWDTVSSYSSSYYYFWWWWWWWCCHCCCCFCLLLLLFIHGDFVSFVSRSFCWRLNNRKPPQCYYCFPSCRWLKLFSSLITVPLTLLLGLSRSFTEITKTLKRAVFCRIFSSHLHWIPYIGILVLRSYNYYIAFHSY